MWLLVKPVGSALLVVGRHSTRKSALKAASGLEGGREILGVVPECTQSCQPGCVLRPEYLWIDDSYKREADHTKRWRVRFPLLGTM